MAIHPSTLARSSALALAVALVSGCGSGFYAAPVHRTADYEAFDARLAGWTIGATAPLVPDGRTIYFTEVSWLRDDAEELEVADLRSGVGERWTIGDGLGVGANVDFGYQRASVDRFRNSNYLYSLGLSGQVDVPLGPYVVLFARVGGRYAFDRTARATCVDGSTSDADGPGVCDGSGGVDFFNDELGDGWVFETMAGIRFRIGR